MIQYNTRNNSFLKMHYILKTMGIKNNAFFLELKDPDLLYVDPFDEDELTLELQFKILIEIKRNPWYFFREILRVPGSGGENYFELHRGNLALYTCLLQNINVVMLTPRQCYKTTSIMAFYLWGLLFGFINVNIGMFTLTDRLSQENMKRLKDMRDFLPSYLKIKNKKDVDNATTIQVVSDGNSSKLMTKAVGTTEEQASNSARGFSFPILYYDEFAFINQIEEHYNTAVRSYATAAEAAEKNNSFHHIVMTTTAGNLYSNCGKWAWSLMESSAPFHEIIYDMTYQNSNGTQFDKAQIYSYILNQSTNSRNIDTAFVKIEYEYFELGKSDDYLEKQRDYTKSSKPGTFEREVLLKWMAGSGDHPLGHERVERLREYIRKPNHIEVIDKIYFLNVYRDYIDRDIPYIVGVDCSGNMNKDFSTFVALDPTNFEVVATMRINQYTINRFSKTIVYLMTNYFPKGVVIIERNGVGLGVVDYVSGKLPPNRVFKDDKDIAGINSTKELRELLYSDILRQAAIEYYQKIHDKNIIDEIFTLEYNKQGKIDHPAGYHDDTLMAYLWTLYFLLHYKSKSKYIDPIYISLHLNDSEYKNYTNQEIEEKLNMDRQDLHKRFNRWHNGTKTNFDLNHDLMDGSMTPEELVLNQNKKVREIDEDRFTYNKPVNRFTAIEYIKKEKERMNQEDIKDIHSSKYTDEKADEIESYREKDTDEIENKISTEEKLELQRKFYENLQFNRNKGNNSSLAGIFGRFF